jgi:RNA polymerase sigma-70 factor (ECF subfamily)
MAARGRDEFWQAWLAERRYFYARCLRWLGGNRHDAEDVLGQAALHAFEYLRRHGGEVRRFRPWMLKILRNLCIDATRGRSRAEGLRRGEDAERWWPAAGGRAPPSPERALLDDEVAGRVVRAAEALPERLRLAFVMRFVDEMDYEDIADALAISLQNARKRVQQARDLLRAELGADR